MHFLLLHFFTQNEQKKIAQKEVKCVIYTIFAQKYCN